MLQVLPKMELSQLEAILEQLPEPDSVKVRVYGRIPNDFSYSLREGVLESSLKEPSKDSILQIYKDSLERERPPKEEHWMDFEKANWNYDNGSVKLTPYEVKVQYTGKEPIHITRLRKKAENLGFKLEIMINSGYVGKIDPNKVKISTTEDIS